MRLRFTIRDLLWLTLVAAVGAGWFAREQHWRQLQADPNVAQNWRGVVGALEWVCARSGFEIRAYDFESGGVHFSTRGKKFGNMSGWGLLGFEEPHSPVLGPNDPRPNRDVDFGQQAGP